MAAADRRKAIINDPQEVLDSLDFENFSLENIEVAFKHLMDKLEFQLPNKLIIPSMYFFISNHLASVIKVQEKNIVYEFDPRGFGLLSDKVINTLNDIKHPIQQLEAKNIDYSMTLDQNLLNSLFIEMSTIHKEFSLRYWASFFDRKAQYIQMMNTNMLMFNMPSITREYGS